MTPNLNNHNINELFFKKSKHLQRTNCKLFTHFLKSKRLVSKQSLNCASSKWNFAGKRKSNFSEPQLQSIIQPNLTTYSNPNKSIPPLRKKRNTNFQSSSFPGTQKKPQLSQQTLNSNSSKKKFLSKPETKVSRILTHRQLNFTTFNIPIQNIP